MKFGIKVRGLKSKNVFVRGHTLMTSAPILPNFSPPLFSMGRSEHHCNEARGPNLAVNRSHKATQEPLYTQSWNMLQSPILSLKHKNGICLIKCFTQHISATAQDIRFKKPPTGTGNHMLQVQLSREQWRHARVSFHEVHDLYVYWNSTAY